MRELLPDNIVLMADLEGLPEAAGGAQDMPQQRDAVTADLGGIMHFVMCVAIVTEKHLEKVKPSCILIREAQHHGGKAE